MPQSPKKKERSQAFKIGVVMVSKNVHPIPTKNLPIIPHWCLYKSMASPLIPHTCSRIRCCGCMLFWLFITFLFRKKVLQEQMHDKIIYMKWQISKYDVDFCVTHFIWTSTWNRSQMDLGRSLGSDVDSEFKAAVLTVLSSWKIIIVVLRLHI